MKWSLDLHSPPNTAYKTAKYLFFLDKSYFRTIQAGLLGGQGDLQDWYI